MRVQLITALPGGSEQRQVRVYAVYFVTVYRTSGTLGIFAVMSLGKVYYGPKHSAGFESVAKLVKASKN
jgi:hypothetical protein